MLTEITDLKPFLDGENTSVLIYVYTYMDNMYIYKSL